MPTATPERVELPPLEAIRAERARRSLRVYLECIWPIVEPHTPFVGGFHLDASCEYLEAVERREIRNLLITMPPRFSKSLTASVAFPTWAWTRAAGLRFLTAAYAESLSVEHAVLSRRVIESAWYQQHFRIELTTDQNIKTHYENIDRGYRIATSVGGTTTGRGGDFLILDDPHNLKERHSKAARDAVRDWYQKVWYTRLNDPKRGCRVVIMQRCHVEDLAAALLDSGQYEHLNLRQEYDPKKRVVLRFTTQDPRTEPGALLCPERMGPEEVAGAKAELQTEFSAQHNQDPVPEAGLLFKREWFTIVDARPALATRVRGWDMAGTDGGGDYTAGVLMARTPEGRYVIEDVVRGQWGPEEGDRMLKQTAQLDGRTVRVREEQEPGSAGKKVIAAHLHLLAGWDYRGETASGDKVTRVRPFRAQCEGGNVALVRGAWNRDFLDELCAFPEGKHDDQVDAAAVAFNDLALSGGGVTPQLGTALI